MGRVSVVKRTAAAASLAAFFAIARGTWVLAQEPRMVEEGDRIRVMARDPSNAAFFKPTVGTFAGATADTIYLRGPVSLIPIDRASVKGVELSAGRVRYAKTGAIVGAVLGATVGVAGVVAYCANEDCETAPQAALAFGTVFGAAAGGIGALLGLAIPGKDRWVPAKFRLLVLPRR